MNEFDLIDITILQLCYFLHIYIYIFNYLFHAYLYIIMHCLQAVNNGRNLFHCVNVSVRECWYGARWTVTWTCWHGQQQS